MMGHEKKNHVKSIATYEVHAGLAATKEIFREISYEIMHEEVERRLETFSGAFSDRGEINPSISR